MKKVITLLLLFPLLIGCTYFGVHKMDIEQGNIITEANVARVHQGMSEERVRAILGEPLLVNIFTPNQLAYVYTMQPGHKSMTLKKAIFTFNRGRLVNIEKVGV